MAFRAGKVSGAFEKQAPGPKYLEAFVQQPLLLLRFWQKAMTEKINLKKLSRSVKKLFS